VAARLGSLRDHEVAARALAASASSSDPTCQLTSAPSACASSTSARWRSP
jgi:hypothetical protein